MSRVVVASLIRNEADRFLRSAIEAWQTFADEIVILDDDSDDRSYQIALERGCRVYARSESDPVARTGEHAWGAEAEPRARLWALALEHAKEGDWIFILDADMVPARSPRNLFKAASADAAAFVLYDLWGMRQKGVPAGLCGFACAPFPDCACGTSSVTPLYRDDAYWQGHNNPRIWAVRAQAAPAKGWRWNERGIHCGHLPANLEHRVIAYAPHDYGILHYGYSSPAIRAEKHARYTLVESQLSAFERTHKDTILDPNPNLLPLPFTPELTLRRPKHAYAVGDA